MKTSEMNATQKKAFFNIKYAAYELLGGLENTMMDNSADSREYIEAKKMLENHELLVKELYEMATTEIHGEGFCIFNPQTCKKELREINFCGKEWLMARCEARIKKEGY